MRELLELVDAARAARSALDEAVEEKTVTLEKVRAIKDRAQNFDAQANYIPEKVSKKYRSSCSAVESTNKSIQVRGKLSLGHTWLRSLKSTHILHLPFLFLTITKFKSQYGHCTSLMKPAAMSLLTSSTIAWLRSRANVLLLCLTGLMFGITLTQCVITSGLTPSMSVYDQSKLTLWAFRNLINWFLSSPCKLALIFTVYSGPMDTSSSRSTTRGRRLSF